MKDNFWYSKRQYEKYIEEIEKVRQFAKLRDIPIGCYSSLDKVCEEYIRKFTSDKQKKFLPGG